MATVICEVFTVFMRYSTETQ